MKKEIFTSSDTHFYENSEKIHLFDTFYAEVWKLDGAKYGVKYGVFLYTEIKGVKRFKSIGIIKTAQTEEKAYKIVEWAKNNKERLQNWTRYHLERLVEEKDYEDTQAKQAFKQYFKD